jgi:putative MATE family efflux protein
MMLNTINSLMDVAFVGRLPHSKEALAATGVGGQIIFLLIGLALGISVGTTALVARFTGAQEPHHAARTTGQSLTLSVFAGMVCTLVFYLFRGALVSWLLDGASNHHAVDLCMRFLDAALIGTVPLFMLNVLMSAFRGVGDTRTPMVIQVGIIATHISLNVLLIFGNLGFPRLGVVGAGIAVASSYFVGAALFLATLMRRQDLGSALTRLNLTPDMVWIRRILKIGIPASVQATVRTLGMMSFTGMIARTIEHDAGVAALQIGLRAEAIAFMPGFGYSVAASTLVGQNLGARLPERAERSGWVATWQGVVVMALMALLFFSCARPLAGSLTNDPQVRELGAAYLRVTALGEPFLALGMVLTGALQGAGETVAPTWITVFTMWIFRLPLAWWLMFKLALNTHGAWYSMTMSTVVGGIMTVVLYRSGKWKKIRV